MVYGPAGTGEPPCPRWSTRITRQSGVSVEQVRAETGWPLALAAEPLAETPPPTPRELEILRSLRTVGQ